MTAEKRCAAPLEISISSFWMVCVWQKEKEENGSSRGVQTGRQPLDRASECDNQRHEPIGATEARGETTLATIRIETGYGHDDRRNRAAGMRRDKEPTGPRASYAVDAGGADATTSNARSDVALIDPDIAASGW